MLRGELFDKPGANVMTRIGVFSAWVAKSNNKLDVSQRLFLALCLSAAFCFRRCCTFFAGDGFFFTFKTWVVNANQHWVVVFIDFKR